MHPRSFLTAACLLGSVLAQARLKIMPLGDSITAITCWRHILWENLQTDSLAPRVNFTGTQANRVTDCGATSPWALHHEGHSGFLATDIANNNLLVGWLAATKPDVVMFHLGTNDIGKQNLGPPAILPAFTKLVADMRASNPDMRIIVDTIIPRPAKPILTSRLNEAIPRWAQNLTTARSPIVVADVNAAFPSPPESGLRPDGIHPNAAGEQAIAAALTPVLEGVIRAALAKREVGGGEVVERAWMA